jgi:hypothetical protein
MKPYYYIFNPADRLPTLKHPTLESAKTEAERLATKHAGKSFEILKCIGVSQTSNVSTFWMDGETGQDGMKYRMLEEGEQIQDGDEINHNGRWECVDDASDCDPLFKCNVGSFRRPI